MTTADDDGVVVALAEGLRGLMLAAGVPSYRALARRAHFSHTVIAAAASGKTLPSLEVTLAFVRACGGDEDAWRDRWLAAKAEVDALAFDLAAAAAPWPAQAVGDGADPEQAGCAADAATVHARKVARHDRRTIVGQVELRYSRRQHAAWGRFIAFRGLEHLAGRHTVVVAVGVGREPDGARAEYVADYAFDWHFSSVLVTGRTTPVFGYVRVLLDGEEIAVGETDRIVLP